MNPLELAYSEGGVDELMLVCSEFMNVNGLTLFSSSRPAPMVYFRSTDRWPGRPPGGGAWAALPKRSKSWLVLEEAKLLRSIGPSWPDHRVKSASPHSRAALSIQSSPLFNESL